MPPPAPEPRGGVSPLTPAVWEGLVKFAGETTDFKCNPAFDRVTFTTALGSLTVARPYILSVSATEIQLLGGSLLKGQLTDGSLPVTWSLGRRDIPMKQATYRRALPPPAIGVDVTDDGKIVPPSFSTQITLTDESLVSCNLRETELRLRVQGAGESAVSLDRILMLNTEKGRLQAILKDGNVVPVELAGSYHLDLLEGALTLTGGERLAMLSFTTAGAFGVVERINPKDGAVMVWVPPGEFLMGSPEGQGDSNERPQHKVYLDSFWIYKHEVTVGQYRKFCQETGHNMPSSTPTGGWKDDHPMAYVSWDDASAYAKWAAVALPTEAQWEKAARGTDGRKYPWGNEWDAKKCCHGGNKGPDGTTFPVGSFPEGASPYGALDMAGNVWEWCADWFDGEYYANSPRQNPTGPARGALRVLRGGSWYRDVGYCRSADRLRNSPPLRLLDDGFRAARTR